MEWIMCTRPGCALIFEGVDDMKTHRGIHHERKLSCVLCEEKYFGKKGGLLDHYKRVHKKDYQMNKTVIDQSIARMENNIN